MISIDIFKKVICELLKPIDESIQLLKRIEVKMDTQAYSNLKGALNSLNSVLLVTPVDEIMIKSILLSLSKSSVYFKALIEQSKMSIENYESFLDGEKKISWIKGNLEYIKLAKNGFSKTLHTFYFEIANDSTLYINSEIGRIICMAALNYQVEQVNKSIKELRSNRGCSERFEIEQLWDRYALIAFGKNIIDFDIPGLDRIKIINEWDSLPWFGKRLCSFGICTNEDYVQSAIIKMYQYLKLIKILKKSKDIDSLIQNIANKKAIKL